jgi:hypothetical protein
LNILYCLLTATASQITRNTNGNRYENAFFGLPVEQPKGWYSQNPIPMAKRFQLISTKLLNNNNKFMQEKLDSVIKRGGASFWFF